MIGTLGSGFPAAPGDEVRERILKNVRAASRGDDPGLAVEPPPSLMEVLEQDELGLVRSVDRVLPEPGAELVIVVDQLEEVFTLVDDEHERSHLLASLRAAAFEPESHVRVVTTLRADFYDVPLSVPGFGDLLAARTEAITPMRPEELERAIVAPADRAGLVVEPRLLAEMIAEVADRPGADRPCLGRPRPSRRAAVRTVE